MMEQISAYAQKFPFAAVVPVSARDGSGMDELIEELTKLCQPGGHLFPTIPSPTSPNGCWRRSW